MGRNNQQGGSQQQGGRDQGGNTTGTQNRGFAAMDDDLQRSIAAEGGRAAHAQGTAHEWDSEEAREAGRKGGQSRGAHASGSQSESDSTDGGHRSQQAQGQERDEQGQFTSDRDASTGRQSSGSREDRGGSNSRRQ